MPKMLTPTRTSTLKNDIRFVLTTLFILHSNERPHI